jgi:hypothetical protein
MGSYERTPPALLTLVRVTMRHQDQDIRWNRDTREWFCAKCGHASHQLKKEDAVAELEQYACELPTPDSGKRPKKL